MAVGDGSSESSLKRGQSRPRQPPPVGMSESRDDREIRDRIPMPAWGTPLAPLALHAQKLLAIRRGRRRPPPARLARIRRWQPRARTRVLPQPTSADPRAGQSSPPTREWTRTRSHARVVDRLRLGTDLIRGHHDFSVGRPASEAGRFPGISSRSATKSCVRISPDFAAVSPTKRQTTWLVCLFAARSHAPSRRTW